MAQLSSETTLSLRPEYITLDNLVDESIAWSPSSISSEETTVFVLVKHGVNPTRIVKLTEGKAEAVSTKDLPFYSPLLQNNKGFAALALAMKAATFLGYMAITVLIGFVLAVNFQWLQARVVLSDSMSGTFARGDLVVTAPWLEPEVGEIAIYQARDLQGQGRAEFVHRIISGNNVDGFQFKGDNNQEPDFGIVLPADIKGVVWFYVPAVGMITQPQVMIAIFSAGLFVYLFAGWVRDEIFERLIVRRRKSK